MSPRVTCEVADCLRPASSGPLCEAHRKRLRRGQPLGEPIRDRLGPWARVVENAIGLANAEGDSDYERRADCLRKAAERWMHNLGWRPPDRRKQSPARGRVSAE